MRRAGTSAWKRARRVMACLMALVLVAGLVPALPESPFALAEEAGATLADGMSDDGGEGIVLGDDPAEGQSGESGSADASFEEGDGPAVELGEDDDSDAGADSGEDGDGSAVEPGEGSSAEMDGEVAATTDDGEPEDGPDVEAQSASVSVSNPRVVEDSSMEAGQVTIWDCVWFGSYPQTEVTWSDAAYASLTSASWDANGDATVGGARYRRISKDDATYSRDWYGTWRYFRYEPIKWRVLEVSGMRALVVADKALDGQMYNSEYEDVTWETSSVRSWLNGYGASSNQPRTDFSSRGFLQRAFSASERADVLTTSVENADNTVYGTPGGNITSDKVFLLSEAEVYDTSHGFASSYGTYDEARRCKATDYARAMGAWVYDYGDVYDGNCWWWLRSPGNYADCAASVSHDGYVNRSASGVVNCDNAVRPALNLNLASSHLQAAGTVSSNGAVDEQVPVVSVSVSNPRVVADSSMDAGQVTTWDCVWFGSYPQTEVTSDDAAYASLQSASWDASGDATVGGKRYRRISEADTTSSGYWSGDGYGSATYRYFRYEPIKWRVLSVNGSTALVMADRVLDDQCYNTYSTDVTWETCSVRSWLNGYGADSNQPGADFAGRGFLQAAFSESERAAVLEADVVNESSPYGTPGGSDTRDRVFLLSESEVYNTAYGFVADGDTYDEARRCKTSDYARAMGAGSSTSSDYYGNCSWWLRSPGGSADCAAYVCDVGYVGRYGYFVDYYRSAVRPALNLNLASSHLQAAGAVSSDEYAAGAGDVAIASSAEVVDRVRAYTSGDLASQFSVIADAGQGDEAKFKGLHEFLVGKGILNGRDGIGYLSQTTQQRQAYDGLVCDDAFIAHQHYRWLSETASGGAARASMLADGYVFDAKYDNHADLPAVVKEEAPNVRKCRDVLYDLLDGIGLQEVKAGYAEFIDDAGKAADELDGADGEATGDGEAYARQLIGELEGAKTQKEAQDVLRKAKDLGIEDKRGDGNGKITYGLGESSGLFKLQRAAGGEGKALDCALSTWDDVEDLVTMDAQCRCYASYTTFLKEVRRATDLPLQMRWAANDVLADMDSGPWRKVRDVALTLADSAPTAGGIGVATVTSDEFDSARASVFDDGTVTVADFVDEAGIPDWGASKVSSTGSLSRGSDLIEGYEKLCKHYKDKLVDSGKSFATDGSEEKAWDFLDNYNLLLQLRTKGEDAYRKMTDVGGVTKHLTRNGAKVKREVVDESREKLDKMAFVLDGTAGSPDPERYEKYSSKVKLVVDCPGDVDVYDPDDRLVYTMKGKKESNVTNEDGTFVVTYRPWTGEWAMVALVDSGGYRLVTRVKDEGSVSMKMMTGDDKENVWASDNIAVKKDSRVEIDVRDDADGAITRVDADGDGKYESRKECREVGSSAVRVTGVTLGTKSLKLVAGESATLAAAVSPADATCQDVMWVSANEKVATVQGGKVVAVGKGSTSVMCVSEDNSDVMATCNVTVAPKVVKGKTYTKSSMKYKVTKVATAKKAGAVTLVRAKNATKVTVPVSVKLADGRTYYVTAMGKGAFKSLSKVASVVVGSKVSTVSSGAISNLLRLTSVTLGTGVKKVGSGAMVKTPKLATITVKGKLLKSKASVKGMLKGSKLKKTVTVRVPKPMLKTYKKVFTKTNLSSPQKVVVK